MIVEFSDFQCPFCRAFYTNTLSQLEDEYIDSGKTVLVYKDYPLTSIHPGAMDYGIAAKCAGDQGKWREMHDKIFDEQNKLGPAMIPYG
jgi:protein-disulfide isomerase